MILNLDLISGILRGKPLNDYSYVDEDLKESHSDMLYKTRINGKDGYIYILFEHKSYNDPRVLLQLLKYILRIWEEKYNTKTNKLPIIIPLVIYNGENKWNIETKLINLIEGIEELPEIMKQYIPTYQYEIYDFSPEEKLGIVGLANLKAILQTTRVARVRRGEKFDEELRRAFELLVGIKDKKTFNELFESCMLYLMYTRDDINIEKVKEVAKKVMDERGELIMTITEKLKNEGMEKGIEKGKLEGERELIIEILNQRFGEDFDKSLEEKIRKANEETINQIKKNILSITLDELKELLK
ncbi:Rpn family recombination-promoting nuclease/putative transposase [Petrotoga sp. Shatin.DS.tank11.9.2.9.3]|jgi:predicted transposase/invertase (TIGR01784 family)|uniref:Rpn family recombination-promoting nuclease/putative transposase n=2 Tax=unclassified Petrotoga TaxID=2620614 RepID=UPI0035142AD1